MTACLPTHSDFPTFEDKLGREALLEQVAREIATGNPPLVFGIHGDWGSGKTSFLCKLEHELTGKCLLLPEAEKNYKRKCDYIQNVFTVWFEAFRYQHEESPVVALLQEICRQLPRHKAIAKKLDKLGTMMVRGLFTAIDQVSLEMQAAPLGTGGKAGIKFKNPISEMEAAGKAWDEEHLHGRLTTDHIRRQLKDAIYRLLGSNERNRVCVIIDDLDRCDPAAAFRLLEGIKIHLSLPQCVFVLGINLRQIEQAIAPLLPGADTKDGPSEKRAEAAEYLEKLCTFTWKLPFPNTSDRSRLLRLWLADPIYADKQMTTPLPNTLREAIEKTAKEFDCLPANPRKIKGIANTIRQLSAYGWREEASSDKDLPASDTEADALLIAATIYHFHPELLRYLQTSSGAWVELLNWLGGKTQLPEKASDYLKLLGSLRFPTEVAKTDPEKSATPGGESRVRVFADPVHLNVFRIQELLLAATDPMRRNSVTYDMMARYLNLPRA